MSALAALLRQDVARLRGVACSGDPLLYAATFRRHFLTQYRTYPEMETANRSPHPYRWGRAAALRPVRLPGGAA